LSKKLKKKIEDLCGLTNLDWESRQERAEQILANLEWKQQLCNELQGLSFRELERHLSGVLSERQKKEDNYERKLEAYRDGNAARPKPLRGDSVGARPQQRSLQEILAQVYAPRTVRGSEFTPDEIKVISKFRPARPSPEVLPDDDDGSSEPQE
jgi:hypothetical protein